ncbi:hypothetical protein [Streptomyces djakartensis]|uniref:hypothetical protein n=1 Tax=Streptomyces djakartensis TaxID=68193 RepID=UPI0034DFDB8C
MAWFPGLGITGVVLLVLSLLLDGVLEGFLGAVDALDGLPSLPVVAAFVSMLGLRLLGSTPGADVTELLQGASRPATPPADRTRERSLSVDVR